MKKFLSLALVLATLLTMSVTAFAADNDNKTVEITYGVNDSYTVTIPDSMKVGTDATVSVSDVVIGYGKQLTVSVSSTNEWKLKNNDDTLGYTMKIGDTDVANNGTVLTAKTGETPSATITTALVADQKAKYAGNYTDTLTFSVDVADITINATAMSADDLKTAVATMLANGETDINITLAATPSDEMFTAIRDALSESEADDGSINLTLKGTTKVIEKMMFISSGGSRFSVVDKLHSISLPDATEIGNSAFSGCKSLVSVNAPKVTSVGDGAFSGCTSLTSLELPSATKLGNNFIGNSNNLTELKLTAKGSIELHEYVFHDATTTNLDLYLNSDKQSEVSGTTWNGFTFKSITFVVHSNN